MTFDLQATATKYSPNLPLQCVVFSCSTLTAHAISVSVSYKIPRLNLLAGKNPKAKHFFFALDEISDWVYLFDVITT